MSFFVYILLCSDSSLYTGVAKDVQKRLRQHNGEIAGGAKYTQYRRPVSLVYMKDFLNRSAAQVEESRIKKLRRKEKEFLVGIDN